MNKTQRNQGFTRWRVVPNAMRYFPLTTDRFEHQFGVRALTSQESIIEATEHYDEEINLKRRLLAHSPQYYAQSLPDSRLAESEVAKLVIQSAPFLVDGINKRRNEPIVLDAERPLLAIAQHVQEDLAIISGDADNGYPLIAGCVTFPSGWCIGDKLGSSTLDLHAQVPEYEQRLHPPTARLFDRIKLGRPVWRTNWGIRPSDHLDQSPLHREKLREQIAQVTAANAGHQCHFRVERQTLARLPESNCILFAIHTHQTALNQLSQTERSRLLGVLQTCPRETLLYKGILPMLDALLQHLADESV